MNNTTQRRLITAREAEAYVPPLKMFVGCDKARDKLLSWLNRPVEQDANLLIEGKPGTGKTGLIIAYLREQFKNPAFYLEQFEPKRVDLKASGHQVPTLEEAREWQKGSKERIYYKQIDGATDSEVRLRSKIEEVRYAWCDHKTVLVDEVGEMFFRGFDEMLRPLLTEWGITTYMTAQNFHSKRKTDSFKEEDERLSALFRRIGHREKTGLPNERDHLRFLVFLIKEWKLTIDHPSTLRLLVDKSEGIVGWSKRILVKAIDEPNRCLTMKLVEESDVNPLC